MKFKSKLKNILSLVMATTMLVSTAPTISYAAQINEYVDPADTWITSNGRSNELDFNATVTQETVYCCVCNKYTVNLIYRVPEYTKSGSTALNRGVMFSDGTMTDGVTKGNVDDGLPGVDASYTTYHWTKSVCQTCGTINSVDGEGAYNFNKNVYSLNSCDNAFFLDFDNTTHEQYNDTNHTTILKKGQYCQFCKGTKARATEQLEKHNFTEIVDGQIGNNRFYVSEHCDDCNFETNKYVTAKSVVSSYYGTADGKSHTVTVSDLSDGSVHTSIRYGTTAEKCNLTSAPNYTEPGYYPVYYEIDYEYDGNNMTENGVSYVWLLADNSGSESSGGNTEAPHVHDYRYVETVAPSCTDLGFERWQCDGCGRLEKRNYTPATGHSYEDITIREATCKQGGRVLTLCKKCGDFHETTTPIAEHSYNTKVINPTCRNVGYTEHTCEVCGDTFVTDIQPLIAHSYERITKEPTCTDKGYTTSTCTMCDSSYVSDYTDATGHQWDEGTKVTSSTCTSDGVIEFHCLHCDEKMIKAESATGHTPGAAATCTQPQLCKVCGTVLELPKGHSYKTTVVPPTCTAMGYTVYECSECGDSYTADFTDKSEHSFIPAVTAPTCSEMGYTTYTCENCGESYVSDYTDKIPHDYETFVTAPTCTQMGHTTYTCKSCGDSYISDYTEMTEHNYNKEVIPPTCTEHGYTVYKCPDCGKKFIGDYTDCEKHHYVETITEPTCTEMGYTTYTCESCGDTYTDNYTDKIPHDYETAVTEPTCTDIGYTTYTCKVCGENHRTDYINALGHKPSEWIVDVPATIENAGSKHIECLTCGTTMQTAEIPQLVDSDHSDEDGDAEVGNYSIILTDENGKPVFDSEISIDVDDNVTIKLPEGRLLDYEDRTTITVFHTETQEPKENLQIFIYDKNNNAATGKTNASGQLVVPNNQSSTGDDNGTIGTEDGDEKKTFVVTVTDKTNVVIPNCDIYIGESNNLVVDLPEGVKPTSEYPVIITVTDQNGKPQTGVTVIALGSADYIEKGITDIYGKVTLPITNEGYTDEDGKVNVNGINVLVNDETGFISNAYVIYNEDGTISVTLPEDKTITHANRITVTVLDSMGIAKPDTSVTVKDVTETTYTGITDENGKMVVPPLTEDYTDSEGKGIVNGYNVLITDEQKPIENAFITIADGKLNVKLPEGVVFDYNNRITATVTDMDNAPVKDMSVIFTDSMEKTETNLTDENGKATVPPIHIDYTDVNGYAEVDGYSVTVTNETGAIEKAFVTHNAEVKNEDGSIKTDENISVVLPENVKFDYTNRIMVTILNKTDSTAVKDMTVIVSELAQADSESEVKTLNGKTNANGKVVFPPLSEDVTDGDGNSDITEETPGKGEDTDGDGVEDKPGEIVTTTYNVKVNDTKGVVTGSFVEIKDGKVTVTLPEDKTLTTSNQTTVTITDKENKPVSGVSVTVKDKTTEKTATTNSNGQITVPVKSSSGGGSSSGGSSGGGGGSISYSTVNVKVTDKDEKNISVSKSTGTDKVTLTLPTGKTLEDGNWYTVTVTDRNDKAKADYTVILKDRNNNEVTGKTDDDGIVILPATEHKAYIVGYDDGTFLPDGDMTRAEAATIFARLISEEKGEKISGKADFSDVSRNDWYADYVGYLAKYDIIKGYEDGTFRPDAPVTRAEFVAMAVRCYDLFDEIENTIANVKYNDLNSNHWAYKDIAYATNAKWLNGYADGSFKPDINITRAEVVTVINRATGRTPDQEYINANLSALNKFTDLKTNAHWAFYDIMEAANSHDAVTSKESEIWAE